MGQAFPSSSEFGVQIFQSRVIINVHFDHYNEGFRLFANSVQGVNCQFSEMHLSNGKPQQFPHSNSSDIYMHYRLSFTFVCKCNSAGTVLEWPLNSIQKNKFFNLTRMHMTTWIVKINFYKYSFSRSISQSGGLRVPTSEVSECKMTIQISCSKIRPALLENKLD